MRTGKILGLIVGGVVGLVVIVLLAVLIFVNPNDYKPRLVTAVKHATGRDLMLEGDIKLKVFPWIALELGPASLGNPAGFAGQPLVSFQHAAFRVKLLPLLGKRLEIGRIELDGLDLRLLKNAEGQGNWQGFGKQDATAPAAAPAPNEAGDGEALQGIAGIQITHARISYENFVLDNVSLETGSFAAQGEVPVTLHVEANRGVTGESASIDAKLDFDGDFAAKRYHVAALNLTGLITPAGGNRPIDWKFTAPQFDADLNAQTLNAPTLAFELAGAALSGSVQGTKILDAPHLTGSLTLAPLVVREFLPRLGIAAPKTRDPKAFSLVSAAAAFVYGDNAARLNAIEVTLDDTHLKGSAAVTNLETQALTFDLAVDKIDADGYLAPEVPASAATPTPTTPAPAPTAAKGKPLLANGQLTIGAIHFSPLDLTDVKVTLTAADQVTHVFPLVAQIDGGQYSGNITLDSREALPMVSLDEHLTGIDVGKLLAASAKNIKVTGRGNVAIKATGRGAGADQLMKDLNGHFDAFVTGGAIEGFDLGYEIGRAEALLRRQDMPATPNTKRTAFDALKLSAQITNGVAVTKDLTLSSPVLKVTGQGSLNLPSKAVDFSLLADTLRTAGNVPIQIPVKVTGTTADPVIRPDIEALAKGQLKQKVQDVVQDKLKGLFSR